MAGPAATLRWLSARLAGWGLPLRRGQVVLTGSPLPLFPVTSGRRVVAEARPIGTSRVAIDVKSPSHLEGVRPCLTMTRGLSATCTRPTTQRCSRAREKHFVGLAVTMTRGCQVCTRGRIEKAGTSGLGDDVLNALVDVVSAVNAGVTAATAREGFRLADAAAGPPCDDVCAAEPRRG